MSTGRRHTGPSSLAPLSKGPVISVEDWEAKAPLGDLQLRSVNLLKSAGEKAPLPLKVSCASGKTTSTSRPSTPTPRNSQALLPPHPVQTPQQFYDWFALIDRSVAHSQEAHFRAHVASVSEHLETCDQLIGRIDLVDKEVDEMLERWRGVEEGGMSLKGACERLLEERVCCFHFLVVRELSFTQTMGIGQTAGAHSGDWNQVGILPRARACYSNAQPPWRISRSADRLLVHGRASRHLY
jgi:hypothetical protein